MTDRPAPLPISIIRMVETLDEFNGGGLGMRIAVLLMQNFGGQEVKFPKHPAPDHPVVKALGETEAAALCRVLGGGLVYVPHGRPRRSVRPEVLDLAGKGYARAEIARMLGISQRHVRRAANIDPPRQPGLFD